MNKVILKSNGKRIRGDLRQKRGKVEGEFEDLYRFLEQRYGYSKEKAKEEVDRRIRR